MIKQILAFIFYFVCATLISFLYVIWSMEKGYSTSLEPCTDHAFSLQNENYYITESVYEDCVEYLPEMIECMGNYYQADPNFYCGV